jgi:hypothetical protein
MSIVRSHYPARVFDKPAPVWRPCSEELFVEPLRTLTGSSQSFLGQQPDWLRVYECDAVGRPTLLKDLRRFAEDKDSREYVDIAEEVPGSQALPPAGGFSPLLFAIADSWPRKCGTEVANTGFDFRPPMLPPSMASLWTISHLDVIQVGSGAA